MPDLPSKVLLENVIQACWHHALDTVIRGDLDAIAEENRAGNDADALFLFEVEERVERRLKDLGYDDIGILDLRDPITVFAQQALPDVYGSYTIRVT
jgi:hypothetical protein